MSEFLLSWALKNNGGGSKEDFTWNEINNLLEIAFLNSGSVGIEFIEQPEIGPVSLDVEIDNGYSLLCLNTLTKDDCVQRTFVGKNSLTEEIWILGNKWHPAFICTDFKIVVQAFKEFFEKGDVSHEILD